MLTGLLSGGGLVHVSKEREIEGERGRGEGEGGGGGGRGDNSPNHTCSTSS